MALLVATYISKNIHKKDLKLIMKIYTGTEAL